MARDQYLDRLGAIPLFAGCNKRQLEEIGRVADEITLPAGQVLMTQGATGSELLLILEGTASVVRDGITLATIGPGEFVGELAVIAAPRAMRRPRRRLTSRCSSSPPAVSASSWTTSRAWPSTIPTRS